MIILLKFFLNGNMIVRHCAQDVLYEIKRDKAGVADGLVTIGSNYEWSRATISNVRLSVEHNIVHI